MHNEFWLSHYRYLTVCGVAHLVIHETSGMTNSETILPIPQETSGGILSAVDMVVQRHDVARWLHDWWWWWWWITINGWECWDKNGAAYGVLLGEKHESSSVKLKRKVKRQAKKWKKGRGRDRSTCKCKQKRITGELVTLTFDLALLPQATFLSLLGLLELLIFMLWTCVRQTEIQMDTVQSTMGPSKWTALK